MINKTKRIFGYTVTFCMLISLAGCNSEREKERRYFDGYDAGLEAEGEETEAPKYWTSEDEKNGYEDGINDSEAYDDGYDDGREKKKPEMSDDAFYMEGYADGKKSRKGF